MARNPRKSPIATKPFPPLGKDVELLIWRDENDNQYTIPLEDWQVYAVQQVLGLYVDKEYIHHLSQAEVGHRIKKMGELSIAVEE